MPIRPENRDRYPADWKAISLRIRTVRAAGRCECCGECGRGTHTGRCPNVNGGTAYGTGSKVVLTVAHLNHTPEDCRDENLRAMCNGCHLHYDRDHHRQTAAATRRAAVEAAGQLALDCEPDWADEWEPTDRVPTRFDLRQAELRDLRDQGPSRRALRTAHTVPTGSYL